MPPRCSSRCSRSSTCAQGGLAARQNLLSSTVQSPRSLSSVQLLLADGSILIILCACAENGPFHITSNLTLEKNPYGWDQSHNMIFVDQVLASDFIHACGVCLLVVTGRFANPMHGHCMAAEHACTGCCAAHQHGIQLQQ